MHQSSRNILKNPDSNIVLIGMPGVGKSTVGVLLAKALSRNFTDTDVFIQSLECRRLQDILDGQGRDTFLALEERYILSLNLHGHVIATGGSVVYSKPAMNHLADKGVIVHLDLPFDMLERRINNLPSRGVVMASGQTLRTLYDERQPLYRHYANITIPCKNLGHDEVVLAIIDRLRETGVPLDPA